MRRRIVLLFLAFVVGSCDWFSEGIAPADLVGIDRVSVVNGGRKLVVQYELAESAWYSPGVKVMASGRELHFSAVRCRTGDICDADVAMQRTTSGVRQVELELEPRTRVAYLVGRNGEKRLIWER